MLPTLVVSRCIFGLVTSGRDPTRPATARKLFNVLGGAVRLSYSSSKATFQRTKNRNFLLQPHVGSFAMARLLLQACHLFGNHSKDTYRQGVAPRSRLSFLCPGISPSTREASTSRLVTSPQPDSTRRRRLKQVNDLQSPSMDYGVQ